MKDFDRSVRGRMRGGGTHSGVVVTEESALRYAAVYACVRVIAETMGSLPLNVYRRRPGGGKEQASDHPVAGLIHDLPNDEMTSQTWREAQTGHLALSGNSYSIISHSASGKVTDLYPVDWHMVTPWRDPATRKLWYAVNDRGKPDLFPKEKIFHVPGWGFDGIQGYSPVRVNAEAIGIGLASAEFAARFYGQGMNMGVVLEHPGVLGTEGRQNLKDDLVEQGAGMENSWQPLILEENMKLNRIPMPLKDAQFIEQFQLTDVQICGFFRMQPHMIGRLERATFSNIESQDLSFVKYTMLPYLTRFEQTANWKLFTPAERAAGYYAKLNVEGLLRGDYKSRQEGLQIQRQNAIINADEWREKEDLDPQPDGVGQRYYINSASVPVDNIGQQPPADPAVKGGGTNA